MIIYLLVRRRKQNIFLEASESDTVLDIKLMVEGILKKAPQDQQLYYLKESDESAMSDETMVLLLDNERLLDRGITANNAKAQSPARLGLCLRAEGSADFEPLEITPYSSPPPLPDIMKPAPAANDSAHGTDQKQ
jgi:transcription elongation factor B subunit 2